MTGNPEIDAALALQKSEHDAALGARAASIVTLLTPHELQAMALSLGFEKTQQIVSEMLFALLPEEAVVVAMDSLAAEKARLSQSRKDAVVGSAI